MDAKRIWRTFWILTLLALPVVKPLSVGAAVVQYQHDNVTWPNAQAGDVAIAQDIQVDSPQAFHYWASYFDVTPDAGNPLDSSITAGYIGLQAFGSTATGRYPRSVIMSFWGGTVASPTSPNCIGWPADPLHPSPAEQSEGGYGMQCAVPFAWQAGQPVRLRIARDGTGTGPNSFISPAMVPGTYWVGTATQGALTVTIGRIFVPGVVHRLLPSVNFSEQFVGMPDICNEPGFSTRARFYQPITEASSPSGVVVSRAGAPGAQTFVNPCPTRQFVDSALDYAVVEQGPNPSGPWAPTGRFESIERSNGTALTGWVDLPGSTEAIPLRVTVNGTAATDASGASVFYSNAQTGTEVRRFSIPMPLLWSGQPCVSKRVTVVSGVRLDANFRRR